jgi:methyl-accepting chemotaxis protein-like sensor
MAALPNTRREEDGPAKSSLPPAVMIVFFATLLAGVAASLASGALAWVAVCAVAFAGAYFASRTAPVRKGNDLLKVRRLILMLDRPGAADSKAPPEFTEEWATLFERMNRSAFESRSNATALTELERVRKQIDLASKLLRDGKDPLTEAPELRVGPLQSLLEGMKSGGTLPFVSHLSLGEEELIGSGGEPLPSDWPRPTGEQAAAPVSHDSSMLETGLKAMVRDLEELRGTLAAAPGGANPASADDAPLRTPAQLVDSVVLTAADGIEDLAAGLMRANELASIAERVTNRATLLALNAALEATRSGSESFAAIAEETRRLAEFAREATDTISRLSSEIEYKVGETITAIHAASENAKTSLAEMSGSAVPVSVPSAARTARVLIVRLLDRSRELLTSLGMPAASDPDATASGSHKTAPAESSAGPNSMQDIVENGPAPADRLPVEGILLIEGLKPGAHFES